MCRNRGKTRVIYLWLGKGKNLIRTQFGPSANAMQGIPRSCLALFAAQNTFHSGHLQSKVASISCVSAIVLIVGFYFHQWRNMAEIHFDRGWNIGPRRGHLCWGEKSVTTKVFPFTTLAAFIFQSQHKWEHSQLTTSVRFSITHKLNPSRITDTWSACLNAVTCLNFCPI